MSTTLLLATLTVGLLSWACRSHEFRTGTHLRSLLFAYNMYAADNDGAYPTLDGEAGMLSGAADLLYPAYISHLGLLYSGPDDTYLHLRDRGATAREFFRFSSYVYLGEGVRDDGEAKKWSLRYTGLVRRGEVVFSDQPEIRWRKDDALRNGGPVLIELPRPYPGSLGVYFPSEHWMALSRPQMGGLVAYADGRVEFVEYPGEWPMTTPTVEAIERVRGR